MCVQQWGQRSPLAAVHTRHGRFWAGSCHLGESGRRRDGARGKSAYLAEGGEDPLHGAGVSHLVGRVMSVIYYHAQVTTLKRPRSIISQFQTTMLTILIQFDAIRFQSNLTGGLVS